MNNVRNIINEWDPIGLFPYAPKDEYDAEIMAIEEILENNSAKLGRRNQQYFH